MKPVNWNRQLGLAATLFAIGTLAYWLEYKHRPDQEASVEQSKRVFQVKDQSVHSMTLKDPSRHLSLSFGCTDLSLKLCKPGESSKWQVLEPTKLKADDSNVNALLSTLSGLTSTEVIDLKDESAEKKAALLKEYGLDLAARQNSPGVKQVSLKTDSGETALFLGNTHPIGESIFGLVSSEGKADESHIYLIPSHFRDNFDHDLSYWRNKKLMTVGAHEIASFTLSGSKGQLSTERKDNQWIIKSKEGELPGDLEGIDGFLSSLTSLTANNFAADSKDSPQAKKVLQGIPRIVSIVLQKEKGTASETPAPVTLQIFKQPASPSQSKKGPTKAFVTVSNLDPLFEIDGNSINRFDKGVKDLRLTQLITSMDRFSAKKIEVKGGSADAANSVLLTQSDGKWMDQEKLPISQEKVQNLLDQLAGSRIQDFLKGDSLTAHQKVDPKTKIKVTVNTSGENKAETQRQFEFWKADGKLFGRDLQSHRNEIYLIDAVVQSALPWEKDFFKLKVPNPVPSAPTPSGKK